MSYFPFTSYYVCLLCWTALAQLASHFPRLTPQMILAGLNSIQQQQQQQQQQQLFSQQVLAQQALMQVFMHEC